MQLVAGLWDVGVQRSHLTPVFRGQAQQPHGSNRRGVNCQKRSPETPDA